MFWRERGRKEGQEQKTEQGVVAKRNQWDRGREKVGKARGRVCLKNSVYSYGAIERVKVMDAYRHGSKLKGV